MLVDFMASVKNATFVTLTQLVSFLGFKKKGWTEIRRMRGTRK